MRIGDLIRKVAPRKLKEVLAYKAFDEYSNQSFSQEGEDVLLKRIFDHTPNGFYVDIGAHHPFRFSNTKLLYDRGWRGINIDANPEVLPLFEQHRSRDINLNLGVGTLEGKMKYHMFDHPALNSFDDSVLSRLKDRHKKTIEVQVTSLEQILTVHLPQGMPINFFSIDVEGWDLEVLKSNDWSRFRPTFILVESAQVEVVELSKSELYLFLESVGYTLISKLWKTSLFRLKN